MLVYRLAKHQYALDLSGKGAELFGGRWNNKGKAMLYTSENRALCLVEIAVHTPLGIIPQDYMMTTIKIPDKWITTLPVNELPADWDHVPHSASTQALGDRFLNEGRSLALKVPSALVKNEFNVLINPIHKAIQLVKIISMEAFDFDSRIFPR